MLLHQQDQEYMLSWSPFVPLLMLKLLLLVCRRMEDLKNSEQRATVEDLMYASVLEKFMELKVEMMPRYAPAPPIWPTHPLPFPMLHLTWMELRVLGARVLTANLRGHVVLCDC